MERRWLGGYGGVLARWIRKGVGQVNVESGGYGGMKSCTVLTR